MLFSAACRRAHSLGRVQLLELCILGGQIPKRNALHCNKILRHFDAAVINKLPNSYDGIFSDSVINLLKYATCNKTAPLLVFLQNDFGLHWLQCTVFTLELFPRISTPACIINYCDCKRGQRGGHCSVMRRRPGPGRSVPSVVRWSKSPPAVPWLQFDCLSGDVWV